MGPNQTKKLLYNKGNNHKNKKQSTEWDKIFANNMTDKGLIFKIYKQLIKHNTKKKTPLNDPIKNGHKA